MNMIAVLLVMLLIFGTAWAENEKKPMPFQVAAHDGKLDVALYCIEDTRIDTLSFEMAGKQLQTRKVQPYSDSGDGCSYLIIRDMPKMTNDTLKKSLLNSYMETLSFIFASMKDEDNAAIIDTSINNTSDLRFSQRSDFFQTIKNMTYEATPNTLNAAIGRALDYFQKENQELRRRLCLVVLTNGFGKSDEGMPMEALLQKLQQSKASVYVFAYPTNSSNDEEVQKLSQISANSKGGIFLTCPARGKDEERQQLFNKFKENENCFVQVEADLNGLTKGENVNPLKATIMTQMDTYSSLYEMTPEEQQAVQNALPIKATETPKPTETPEPIKEGIEEKPEDEKPAEEKTEEESTLSGVQLLIGGGLLGLVLAIVAVCVFSIRSKRQKAELDMVNEAQQKDHDNDEDQTSPEEREEERPLEVNPVLGINRPQLRVVLSQIGMNENAHYEADMVNSLVIGRDPQRARLLIKNDKRVSRVHAKLTYDGQTMRLEDCKSANGTRLNGALITVPCVLQQGDEITFGQTTLRIRWIKV